jgi:hypothetical protein
VPVKVEVEDGSRLGNRRGGEDLLNLCQGFPSASFRSGGADSDFIVDAVAADEDVETRLGPRVRVEG